MTITIHANGSKFAGDAPDTIEQLIAVLRDPRYVLDRKFERLGDFVTDDPSTGRVSLLGNFLNLSHVFNITADSRHEVAELIAAIEEQKRRPDYLSQPAPAPVIASPDDIDAAFADRAFNGTSWTPEKRGYLYRDEYANGVNGFYAEMWPLAKTDEQKALLATEMERFRQGYLDRMKSYLASHANVVSTFIAGPSKFPSARMQKRGQWADNKMQELTEWRTKARHAIIGRIQDARPLEAKLEAEWNALRKDLAGSLNMVTRIDKGNEPYNRSAFTNSVAGKIERLAQNGEVDLVEKALAWLTEHNLDSGKPAFTTRHKVWTFGGVAKESATKLEARAGKANELIAEAGRVELWADYRIDRAQLIFPGKPSHETREKLKRSGWKWSPSNEAWQRQLTDSALQSGKVFVAGLSPAPERELETDGPAR